MVTKAARLLPPSTKGSLRAMLKACRCQHGEIRAFVIPTCCAPDRAPISSAPAIAQQARRTAEAQFQPPPTATASLDAHPDRRPRLRRPIGESGTRLADCLCCPSVSRDIRP